MFTVIKDQILGKTKNYKRRSSKWGAVRKEFLKDACCVVCGGVDKLEAHHVVPFHEAPERELDPKNLIALCESKKSGINCHLFVGHLGDYRKSNRAINESISAIRRIFLLRIK
jgi:hypothetical protein